MAWVNLRITTLINTRSWAWRNLLSFYSKPKGRNKYDRGCGPNKKEGNSQNKWEEISKAHNPIEISDWPCPQPTESTQEWSKSRTDIYLIEFLNKIIIRICEKNACTVSSSGVVRVGRIILPSCFCLIFSPSKKNCCHFSFTSLKWQNSSNLLCFTSHFLSYVENFSMKNIHFCCLTLIKSFSWEQVSI